MQFKGLINKISFQIILFQMLKFIKFNKYLICLFRKLKKDEIYFNFNTLWLYY